MMHQDYILRMIEQMRVFVAGLFRLRDQGDLEEASARISDAYGRLAGIPESLVHGLSEEDVVNLLSSRGYLAADRCLALAEILREEGLLWEAKGQPEEAEPRYRKALRLYLESLQESDDLRAVDLPGLDDLFRTLSGVPLPDTTRSLAMSYLESTGQYDQLENVVVTWLETTSSPEAGDFALAMYARLLEKNDAQLIIGGLTRGEVREALELLHQRPKVEISE